MEIFTCSLLLKTKSPTKQSKKQREEKGRVFTLCPNVRTKVVQTHVICIYPFHTCPIGHSHFVQLPPQVKCPILHSCQTFLLTPNFCSSFLTSTQQDNPKHYILLIYFSFLLPFFSCLLAMCYRCCAKAYSLLFSVYHLCFYGMCPSKERVLYVDYRFPLLLNTFVVLDLHPIHQPSHLMTLFGRKSHTF